MQYYGLREQKGEGAKLTSINSIAALVLIQYSVGRVAGSHCACLAFRSGCVG
jgi:hypothetical protein